MPFGTATAKTSVVGGHCPHCQRPLIEIDCYGERLIASVATGPEVSGSVVPSSAVVLSGGEAWCYIEESNDVLARRRVDLGRPVPQGYFQASGFTPGEHVVVAGAGLLLAREIGGGAEAD